MYTQKNIETQLPIFVGIKAQNFSIALKLTNIFSLLITFSENENNAKFILIPAYPF